MKILIVSDIHGSAYYAEKVVDVYKKTQPDTLLLLGDILYHGPRNPLPEGYDPAKVVRLLNAIKENILCVRGNCDSEVDQMVLEFPITGDYNILLYKGCKLFATHGHVYGEERLPVLKKGDVFLQGHTHTASLEKKAAGWFFINPGSVSLPKNDKPPTYVLFEDGVFRLMDFLGNTISKIEMDV